MSLAFLDMQLFAIFFFFFVSFMENFTEIHSFFQFSVCLKRFLGGRGGWNRVVGGNGVLFLRLFVGFVGFYFELVGFFWAF